MLRRGCQDAGMAGEILRFAAWAIVIGFIRGFVRSAFPQGRPLNQAFKPHRRKRARGQ